MQLWSSNIKKIWYFLKERFSYIFSNETLHFSLQARKIKEIHPENNFLHFRKWKQRKNVLHFLKRKVCNISGNGNPEMETLEKAS